MFEDAKPHLERILDLVKLCPENLREKCFDLLLSSYLESTRATAHGQAKAPSAEKQPAHATHQVASAPEATARIPDAIKAKFTSLVQRTKVTQDGAMALFDFTSDPFTYHALLIPDGSKREKMRNLALMLCVKEWLTSGAWTADWKEFRSLCIDNACWDQNNVTNAMISTIFKKASNADGISLTSEGVKSAHELFAKLAGGSIDA